LPSTKPLSAVRVAVVEVAVVAVADSVRRVAAVVAGIAVGEDPGAVVVAAVVEEGVVAIVATE